jgi:ribosomal protein L17
MNNLDKVNDQLHLILEDLMDETKTPEEMEATVKRGKAVVEVTDKITDVAKLQLDATRLMLKAGVAEITVPEQFRYRGEGQKQIGNQGEVEE